MKRYIIFVFLLISISIHAQIANNDKKVTDSISNAKLTGETYFEQKGYKGEQFFNKSWLSCDILLSTGEMIYDEKVKYNSLLDELIWVNSTINQQFKLDKPLIKEFWLKNEKDQIIHFKQITANKPYTPNLQTDFFAEVAVEGNLSLYIQRKISVVNSDDIIIDGILCRQETIRPTPQYFLKLPSNDYILLEKINLKSFSKLLPTQKMEIDKLMKSNNLKLKTENNLIKLITILNE